MYWVCKKCETRNPENAIKCGKCGDKEGATKKFYTAAIFGSALVFVLMYVVGTSVGGTMVAFSVEPADAEVLEMAKSQGVEAKELTKVGPEDQKKAREAVIEKKKQEMSQIVRAILFWFFPLLLFPVIGLAVGFVSAGRTILEAAIGSVLGQIIGYLGMRFMYEVPIHPVELAVGCVVGFGVVWAGAYIGEAVQEKRGRAVLEAQDEEAY